MLSQFEADWLSGFSLPNGRTIEGSPVWGYILDFAETTSQPRSLLSIAKLNIAKSLRLPSTWSLLRRPHVFRPKWRFRPDYFVLVPRSLRADRSVAIDFDFHAHLL